MVGQSDLAFRLLCRSYDVKLTYTQMIHCTNFMRDETFRANHLDIYSPNHLIKDEELVESQQFAIQGLEQQRQQFLKEEAEKGVCCYDEKGPVMIQLAGHNPETILSTAQHILHRTSHNPNVVGFDLNLGCPQGIARKGNYGSFLSDTDPKLVCDILSTLRNNLPSEVKVSAKIRLPEIPTEENIANRIKALIQGGGVNMVAVHGRTRRENKTLVRECSWDAIRYAVQVAKQIDETVPIIANGGIEYASDVAKALDYTNADGIMSSEGLLENPGIFLHGAQDDGDMTPRDIFDRQMKYVRDYLHYATLYPPLPGSLGKKGGSFNVVRGHLFKMLYRYLEEHPDLRNELGDSKMRRILDVQESVVDELQKRYDELGDDEEKWRSLKSSDLKSSWYRRHRDAIKLVHSRDSSVSSSNVFLGGGGGEQVISVEEKKRLMKERIQKMKKARKKKEIRSSAEGDEDAGVTSSVGTKEKTAVI